MSQEPNDAYDVNKWLYVPPFYAEYRYVLGTKGDGPCATGDGPQSKGDGPCRGGRSLQRGTVLQQRGTVLAEWNGPENGDGSLIVIGVNPSTAAPDALDPTLKSAERIAHFNGYDSFWMMNVYPQRATDPDDMERERNAFLEEQNMAAMKKLLELSSTKDVWCAWGNIIDKRKFLKECVQNIVDTGNNLGANWLQAEKTCKSGNPHHPLYLKADTKLISFEP